MILGVGNDIIEIERIKKSIHTYKKRLLNRLFTEKEQAYCLRYKDPIPHFAGRFSAKEAIAKALGTGFGEHISWLDIEILPNSHGKPEVAFSKKAASYFNQPKILLSISHCKTYVSTVALWI